MARAYTSLDRKTGEFLLLFVRYKLSSIADHKKTNSACVFISTAHEEDTSNISISLILYCFIRLLEEEEAESPLWKVASSDFVSVSTSFFSCGVVSSAGCC